MRPSKLLYDISKPLSNSLLKSSISNNLLKSSLSNSLLNKFTQTPFKCQSPKFMSTSSDKYSSQHNTNELSIVESMLAIGGEIYSVIFFPFYISSVGTNHVKVVTTFGKVTSVKQPGLRFFPLFTESHLTFMGINSYSTPEIIVPDNTGKPISIKCLINYKVIDPICYFTKLRNDEKFIISQTERVMKQTVAIFNYDDLRSNMSVSNNMKVELNKIIEEYGVTATDFNITDVQYDKNVASSLLVEQQVHSISKAKTTLVNACTSIVMSTINTLEEKGISFSDSEKAKFATNMMISLTSGQSSSPVIPLN